MATEKKPKTSSGISSQKAIKIDGELWGELTRWLQTSEAKKQGFHSKADFATQAIREMLEKFSSEKKAFDMFITLYHKNKDNLKDVKTPSDFVKYLEQFKLRK